MGKKIFLIALSIAAFLSADVYAQKKAPDWANFKRYAAANEKVTESPKAVLFGDSITDGWYRDDKEFFVQNDFVGRGISGQCTSQMLVRFRRDVVDLHPKYVVILAGINDIALNHGSSGAESAFENIVSMCEIAKANKIKPVLCSLTPAAQIRWRPEVENTVQQVADFNARLKKYAKENKLVYIDYFSAIADDESAFPADLSTDGLHPNISGYKIMEEVLLKTLK